MRPLLILTVLLLSVVACGEGTDTRYTTEPENLIEWIETDATWVVVKSPTTGLCYEVMRLGRSRNAVAAMSQVDCSHLKDSPQ